MPTSLARDLIPALPELLLTGTALSILLTARVWRHLTLVGILALAGFGAALAVLVGQPAVVHEMFTGMLIRTPWIVIFQAGILGVMLIVTLLALGDRAMGQADAPEFLALLLLSAVGLLLVAGAQSLVMVYVGLELVSLTSYLLAAFYRRDILSVEGGLKYFLFGSVATAMLLYGVSWIYGATGTLDLPSLAFHVLYGAHPNKVLLIVGLLLVIVGLGFKVALVPFHQWAPDAYEGAPTPVAAFVSAGPKIAGFAILLRVLLVAFQGLKTEWGLVLEWLAILTMSVGNLAALRQTSIKRLLAYSSIAQAGYIVIGLVAASPAGAIAITYYVLAYVLMNLAAFACVVAVSNATGRDDLGAYAGLSQTHPATAASMTLALLSLAGIPPLAGFLAKVWVFAAALQRGHILLAIVAAINSVIAVYYYAGVIRQMYLVAPQRAAERPAYTWPLRVGLGVSLAGVVVLGLWPTPLLSWIVAALPVAPRP